jgi:hypothetical protein
LPKTNKSVEGWHRAFQDCHHHTVYKLISYFSSEQESVEQSVVRFLAGEVSEGTSKTKYMQLTRKLQTLMPTYGNCALFAGA